jgi:hypothetical protein
VRLVDSMALAESVGFATCSSVAQGGLVGAAVMPV